MPKAKLEQLRRTIRTLESAVLAFSGGVDSALVAYVASQELGNNFKAVTMNSPLLSEKDLTESVQICNAYNISQVVLEMYILNNKSFTANCKDRCYFCKQEIFTHINNYAQDNDFRHVMDGTNSDDSPTRRPGMHVLTEKGVRSPLRECNFTKNDVRAASKTLDLITWSKESDSCLATRIPQGQSITTESLRQIQY